MKKETTVTLLENKEDSQVFVQEYTDLDIQRMIYNIRGQQVMLDSDLAKLYNYTVKRLNEQIKRNIERFPDDFMFQLTIEEAKQLPRSQNATLEGKGTNIKYAPYVFTEKGIYMLPTVLKGKVAVNQSILIIRTFQEMRHYLIENKQLLNNYDISRIEDRFYRIENTMATKEGIQSIMDKFINTDKVKEFAFLKGEQFEADELFMKIYSEAKYSIYIIDNYVSIKTLSHLKHKDENVNVTIFTTNSGGKDKLRQAEFDDFNIQYPTLILKYNHLSHDRYIILDYNTENEKIYHSGASIKDAGKKVCGVNEISETQIYHTIIDELLLQDNIVLS